MLGEWRMGGCLDVAYLGFLLIVRCRYCASSSEQMFKHLNALKESTSTGHLIEDVRGKGLMIA